VSEPKPIFFRSPEEFYGWLEENHETASEVYVGYFKTHTGKRGMSWSEAVDQALCFGWIDTRSNSIDEHSYMQRFTPRRPGSNWSKINVEKVAKLTEAGLMRPAGLAAFEQRSEARTGVYSFERNGEARLPPEYEQRLRANPAAAEYFDSRPPWYRRTAIHLVVSAKREETRERRLAQLIEDSAAGRDIKQLRRA
jgi:uncharacterized protein YdeI (YjbR/CyaY-like superfamily)